MKLSSLNPFSSRSSHASSTEKSSQESKAKSHDFMGGALSGLRPRTSAKVHPEPMQAQEHQRRASLPMSRRTPSHGHQQFVPQQAARDARPAHAPMFGTPARLTRSEQLNRLDRAPGDFASTKLPAQPQRPPIHTPVQSEQHTSVLGMLRDIDEMLKGPSKERHQLMMKLDFDSDDLTDEQFSELESRLDKVNERRDELIAARKEALSLINFLTKPASFPQVQSLMQLSDVHGLQHSGSQRDMIQGNMTQLRQHRHLLGQHEELLAAQAQIRKTLQSSGFSGLAAAELKQMQQLADLDVNKKFAQLSELDDVVSRTNQQLQRMGAGGLFQGIATTQAERNSADEEERRRAQEASDNGYR
jgi:hypothetical protein